MNNVVDMKNVKVTERTIEGAEPPVPMKMVPVTITGFLRDGKTVNDRVEISIPQSQKEYAPAMAWLWNQYRQAGTISFKEKGDKFSIYPLTSFEKIEMEFSSIVGVTL